MASGSGSKRPVPKALTPAHQVRRLLVRVYLSSTFGLEHRFFQVPPLGLIMKQTSPPSLYGVASTA